MRTFCFTENDLEDLEDLYRSRGLEPIPSEMLPETGYIESGVAAGFLYRTDADLALLETFVTHAKASPESRHEALEAIIDRLLRDAKAYGYTRISILFRDDGMARRVEMHGAKLCEPAQVAVKEL